MTDIPTCRRLNPPKALPIDQAIIVENMNVRIEQVTKKYLKKCEKKCKKKGLPFVKNNSRLTETTYQWARFLKLGARWENGGADWKQAKNALRTCFCIAPPMAGYYKDHKPLREDNEQLGPKMRPVCGSVEGSNRPQSHNLAKILFFLGQGGGDGLLEYRRDVWSNQD